MNRGAPWPALVVALHACGGSAAAPRAPTPREAVTANVGAGGGGSNTSTPTADAHPDYLHSPELNRLMKEKINKPFSQLTFYVFHADGDFDYPSIAKAATLFRHGVTEVRAFPDPPVSSAQGREVFATYLEGLDADAARLTDAVTRQNSAVMQRLIGKLSRTCNSCHHFFRLDITDSPEE